MGLTCDGCEEARARGDSNFCSHCENTGAADEPTPAAVSKIAAQVDKASPLEDCEFRLKHNRKMATYVMAHMELRREQMAPLGKLTQSEERLAREFATLSREWRALTEFSRHAFDSLSLEQRIELLVKWLETAPYEHLRRFMERAVAIYQGRKVGT